MAFPSEVPRKADAQNAIGRLAILIVLASPHGVMPDTDQMAFIRWESCACVSTPIFAKMRLRWVLSVFAEIDSI